jgi:hypothetical protein
MTRVLRTLPVGSVTWLSVAFGAVGAALYGGSVAAVVATETMAADAVALLSAGVAFVAASVAMKMLFPYVERRVTVEESLGACSETRRDHHFVAVGSTRREQAVGFASLGVAAAGALAFVWLLFL